MNRRHLLLGILAVCLIGSLGLLFFPGRLPFQSSGPGSAGGIDSIAGGTDGSEAETETPKAVTLAPPSAAANRPAVPPDDREIGVRLHEWLIASPDTAVIAKLMADAFPTVKPEDQAAVAREMVPLVTDDRYAARLPALVVDPKISTEAHQILFRDLGLRPDEIELPLLLEIAKLGDAHPHSLDARLRLALRFGGDPESGWETWKPHVEAELKRRRELLSE
jgi:hypothetical protein